MRDERMATEKPSAATAGTLDQSLELAAANAVVLQQQVAITRRAAVTSAASAMLALFSSGGDAGGDKAPAGGGGSTALAAAAEAAAAQASAASDAFPRAAGFSAGLAALDAGNVLGNVATLSTLLSALALARYVETGEDRYITAVNAAQQMLENATSEYERVCRFATGLGAPPNE
jgi:hypothetical protein